MSYPFRISNYKQSQTKIINGINSIERLSSELLSYQPRKIMIITDQIIKGTQIFKKIINILDKTNFNYVIFDKVLPEPPVEVVREAQQLFLNEKCDITIAVGGGSVIDTGKAMGVLVTNGGKPQDYAGYIDLTNPPVPLVAVPTTAGTGSETSIFAVITDKEKNAKFTIVNEQLGPKLAILDPESLESCPPKVIAGTGMDAFTHAFEGYISLKASPQSQAIDIYAIELISKNLRQLLGNTKNVIAAYNVLEGSSLAGMAMNSAECGNVHCIARIVGPFFNISHGLSNAILLPYVAKFNLLACPCEYARIAQAMGENIQGFSDIEAAEIAVKAIEKLCCDVGIPKSLKAFRCSAKDIEILVEQSWASYVKSYQYQNPRKTIKTDFNKIIQDVSL